MTIQHLRLTFFSFVIVTGSIESFAAGENSIPALSATAALTNVSACGNGHDGKIVITASGGVPPYNYSWSGPAGVSAMTTSVISNLGFGYFNVTVTDAAQNTFTITNMHIGSAFYVYITNSGTMSSGCANNGSILLYGNAGVLPYTYSLDGINYQTSNTFTGLAPITYTAYVKDAAGCISTKSITLPSAPPIIISPYIRPAKSCANNGVIETYRTGGMPPYQYSLDNINYQISNTFANLAGGNYTVWVKDSKNCTASKQLVVPQPPPVTANPIVTNSSKCADDGRIKVMATGGDPFYTYSLNGGPYQLNNTFENLTADTYTISVMDSKGCQGDTTVDIYTNPITLTAEKMDASECLVNDGSIVISAEGGFPPYRYSLDNFNYQAQNEFNAVSSGIYYCYVKDSRDCIAAIPGLFVGPYNCSPERTARGTTKDPINISKAEIKAFPNPSATEFILTLDGFDQNQKVMITVTDILGKKVFAKYETPKQTYRLGKNFAPGMYNLEMLQGNLKKVIKLVKE